MTTWKVGDTRPDFHVVGPGMFDWFGCWAREVAEEFLAERPGWILVEGTATKSALGWETPRPPYVKQKGGETA